MEGGRGEKRFFLKWKNTNWQHVWILHEGGLSLIPGTNPHLERWVCKQFEQKKTTDFTWENLPRKHKKNCGDFCVKKANELKEKPNGFGKADLNFMIRRILFDPLHANHNHAKYGMCSLLMVSKNFFQFVQCIFPPETPDKQNQPNGVHKDSMQSQNIMDLHLLFTKVFEVLKSRNELNIMSGKSEKNFHDHPNDMSASKWHGVMMVVRSKNILM